MKFNEKNVCAFSKVPPFDLEGYLQKRGDVNKSWQKRYFVLKGNLLFYFDRKQDKEPIGLIILEGCRIELSEDQDLPYCFEIIFGGNRIYTLSATDQKSMENWMKTLACSSYEYKKALVEELQTQLEGIEIAQKKLETNKIEQKVEEITPTTTPKAPPRRQNPFNRPAPPPPVAVPESSVTTDGNIVDSQSAAPGNL